MRKEIEALNRAPKDKAAIDGLRQIIGQHACLVLGSNGKIDPSKTEACFEFLQILGALKATSGRYASAVTLDEFLGAKKKALRCDPSVGILDGHGQVALDPEGVSQDAAAVEWGAVPAERLPLVLLGRQSGTLDRHPGPGLRRDWAEALAGPLKGHWVALERSWQALKPAHRDEIEEALTYRRALPIIPPVPKAPPPSAGFSYKDRERQEAERANASVSVGGNVVGSAIVSGNGNTVSAGGAQPTRTFHILSADPRMEQELREHCATAIKAGVFGLTSFADIPFGSNTAEVQGALIARSAAVLVLVTSSALADPVISDTIDRLVAQGKPIIPVLCRPALMPASLARMVAVPRNGTPIANWGDRDSAWAEVVTELRKVALR